jgi:hypothetical protein
LSPPHAIGADDRTIGTTNVHIVKPRFVSSPDLFIMCNFDVVTLAR